LRTSQLGGAAHSREGNPIRYEIREGYPTVWSTGIDRKDDGGIASETPAPDDVLTLNPQGPLEKIDGE